MYAVTHARARLQLGKLGSLAVFINMAQGVVKPSLTSWAITTMPCCLGLLINKLFRLNLREEQQAIHATLTAAVAWGVWG